MNSNKGLIKGQKNESWFYKLLKEILVENLLRSLRLIQVIFTDQSTK